jgi:glutamyl-tRNA synthetase
MKLNSPEMTYRGRLAPSPTGYLHTGHAATFHTAWERARKAGGQIILRIEDLDRARCRSEFRSAIIEDLLWLGLDWDEGPDIGGNYSPYVQSERMPLYREAFETLRRRGFVYPCRCSRREIQNALSAPHEGDEEPIYPGTCRPPKNSESGDSESTGMNWRFHIRDGQAMRFSDVNLGERIAVCGREFGDFLVWRRDDVPSYQLAVTVDDAAMGITEVVRGRDLVISTFRQLLLYAALEHQPPEFYHCELIRDEQGRRLAKRHVGSTLRHLRKIGKKPAALRQLVNAQIDPEERA